MANTQLRNLLSYLEGVVCFVQAEREAKERAKTFDPNKDPKIEVRRQSQRLMTLLRAPRHCRRSNSHKCT